MDWNKVYDILVKECGAPEHMRQHFLSLNGDFVECRFGGILGLGGKIWNNNNRIYVTCYREHLSMDNEFLISRVNRKLAKLAKEKAE